MTDTVIETLRELSTANKKLNRASIEKYEEFAKELPQVPIPVEHLIAGSMYARMITIPAGSFITGQMYKYDHIDIMISGKMSVSTDDGDTKLIEGFNMFGSMSGKKRAGYAHEETKWVTISVHPDCGMTGDEIQANLTVADQAEYEQFLADLSRMDYYSFLEETGRSESQVRAESENTEDRAEIGDNDRVEVKQSAIEGKGLFAKQQFEPAETICAARFHGLRTEAGRYCNHSIRPNCEFVLDVDTKAIILRAITRICQGDELTVSYRTTIAMRSKRGDLACQE